MEMARVPSATLLSIARSSAACLHSGDRDPPGNHFVSVPSPTSNATIGADDVRAGLRRARRAVDRHAPALTRLDAVLGDGTRVVQARTKNSGSSIVFNNKRCEVEDPPK